MDCIYTPKNIWKQLKLVQILVEKICNIEDL